MIIYKTTNLINGKFYVGKDERNKSDYFGSGINLNRAIKKYGKENFIKETIEVCSTKEELNEREKYWIKKTKAQEIGYNIAEGGSGGNTMCKENKDKILNGFKGGTHTPETIEKIKRTREEKKKQNPDAYKISEKQREILSKTHKGKVHPEEWKRNHSEKMKELYHSGDIKFFGMEKRDTKGYNHSPEAIEKIRQKNIGRKASEETRRKMSISNGRYWLGKKHSPEAIEKRKQKILGTKRSDESKENQRIRMLGENNPFYGETHTPETKEKIRQSKINKTPEQMLGTYIRFHISRMGYEPSEEQKQKKLQEYIKKKEK
jgi:group I intron endonuclease